MEALTKSIGELLIDPKYTDLEIQVGGKRYLVHRAIVCKRSKVIERECDGKFKESWTRIIKHDIYDFRAVDRLLQFIYSGDYKLDPVAPWVSLNPGTATPPRVDTNDPKEDSLITHIYVYAIADYYDVPELKHLAREKFTVAKDACEALTTETILELASVMYENTSTEARKLRTQMMNLCYRHAKVTIHNQVFVRAIALRSGLQEFRGDFMAWTVDRMAQEKKNDDATYQAAMKSITNNLEAARIWMRDDFEATKKNYERVIATAKQEKRDLKAARVKDKKDIEAAHAKERDELLKQISRETDRIEVMKNELKVKRESHQKTKKACDDAANANFGGHHKASRDDQCPHCSTDLRLLREALNYDEEKREFVRKCPICDNFV